MFLVVSFFKVLICFVSLYLCNGASPRQNLSFTEEEEHFIIGEILRYPSDIKPIHGTKMYRGMAEKHITQRNEHPSAFPQERTLGSLRNHFLKKMLKKKGLVPVPLTLLEKLPKPHTKKRKKIVSEENLGSDKNLQCGQRNRNPDAYNSEEDRFLAERVLSYPRRPIPIYGTKMWVEIALQFQEKRKQNHPRFLYERSVAALKSHFFYTLKSMISDHERESFFNELRRKSPIEKEENLSDRFADQYTLEEEKFIIDKVLSYPQRPVPIYGINMWLEIAQLIEEERKVNPSVFPHVRSGDSLRSHFRTILKSRFTDQEREIFIKEIRRGTPKEHEDTAIVKYTGQRYTQAEDDFLMEQFLKPSCISMFSMSTWTRIKQKHDEKRQSGTPGFHHKRTVWSLRAHFLYIVGNNDPVRHALLVKFPQQMSKLQAGGHSSSQFRGQNDTLEDIADDNTDVWDSMIDELQNASVEVDLDRF